MKLNDNEINISDLLEEINNDKTFAKMRGSGIYLSDDEVDILHKYDIDYRNFTSLSSLIFEIEEILNENSDLDDLELLSKKLSELNYYNNTNK